MCFVRKSEQKVFGFLKFFRKNFFFFHQSICSCSFIFRRSKTQPHHLHHHRLSENRTHKKMMRSFSRSLKRALSSRFATTTTISTNTTKATLFRFLRTSACVPFTNTNHANESIKKTTGLVGLPVMNDPINTYANLCDQVLEKIQFVPENAAYRTVVEEMYKHRKKVTLSGKTVSEIEETIAAGQIEELAVQARDELELIPKMREWKPWEFSHEIEIEKAENPTGIAKN